MVGQHSFVFWERIISTNKWTLFACQSFRDMHSAGILLSYQFVLFLPYMIRVYRFAGAESKTFLLMDQTFVWNKMVQHSDWPVVWSFFNKRRTALLKKICAPTSICRSMQHRQEWCVLRIRWIYIIPRASIVRIKSCCLCSLVKCIWEKDSPAFRESDFQWYATVSVDKLDRDQSTVQYMSTNRLLSSYTVTGE